MVKETDDYIKFKIDKITFTFNKHSKMLKVFRSYHAYYDLKSVLCYGFSDNQYKTQLRFRYIGTEEEDNIVNISYINREKFDMLLKFFEQIFTITKSQSSNSIIKDF